MNPPACQGKQFSKWRRDVPDCRTSEGALGARDSYIPADFMNKVGLWCNDSDWVCGSSATPAFTSGHGEYATAKGAIDKSIQEIARRLRSALLYPKNQYIDDRYLLNSDGEARLNVAYIWSINSSSQEGYEQTKIGILAAADMVWAQGGRVSVTPFNQFSGWINPLVRIVGPKGDEFALFTTNYRTHIEEVVNAYRYAPIAYPYDEILSPAIASLNGLPWQIGAQKALIFIDEGADYKDEGQYRFLPSLGRPVSVAEYTAQRALEIDPVNMYFVIGSDEGVDDANYLAGVTGGKVVRYNPADPATLQEAIQVVQQEIIDRPIVIFGSDNYETNDGKPIVFDVTSSYVNDAEIVEYAWDFDSDGVWDHTSVVPHAAHVYPDGFAGLVHVKATDSKGRIGTMTASVTSLPAVAARAELPLVQNIHYKIVETKDDKSTVRLTWEKIEEVPYVVLSVNGVHLGSITTDRTSIDITDIVRSQDVSIDLQAMDAQHTLGGRNGVVVKAQRTEVSSVPAVLGLASYVWQGGGDGSVNIPKSASHATLPLNEVKTAAHQAAIQRAPVTLLYWTIAAIVLALGTIVGFRYRRVQ